MKKTIAVAAFAALLLTNAPTLAADVTLKFAHFFAADSDFDKLFKEWAAGLAKDSSGRIEVQVFPAETLARANRMVDSVTSGTVDIGVTVQGYTANRFPLTQIVELPGLVRSGLQGSCTLWKMYETGPLKKEYADVKPVFFWTTGPGHIHVKGQVSADPSVLRGLRLRRPSTLVGEILESFGAQAVGQPAPEMYPSMQRGVIDGVTLAWEGMHSWRIAELTGGHIEIYLYTLSLMAVMNNDVYAKMPADLKPVFDKYVGLEWSQRVGKLVDGLDVKGRQIVTDKKIPIVTVPDGVNNPAWKGPIQAVVKKYIDQTEAAGLPARAFHEQAQKVAASCGTS